MVNILFSNSSPIRPCMSCIRLTSPMNGERKPRRVKNQWRVMMKRTDMKEMIMPLSFLTAVKRASSVNPCSDHAHVYCCKRFEIQDTSPQENSPSYSSPTAQKGQVCLLSLAYDFPNRNGNFATYPWPAEVIHISNYIELTT